MEADPRPPMGAGAHEEPRRRKKTSEVSQTSEVFSSVTLRHFLEQHGQHVAVTGDQVGDAVVHRCPEELKLNRFRAAVGRVAFGVPPGVEWIALAAKIQSNR